MVFRKKLSSVNKINKCLIVPLSAADYYHYHYYNINNILLFFYKFTIKKLSKKCSQVL